MKRIILLLGIFTGCFAFCSVALSQQRQINGTVVSREGKPIQAATLQIVGTTIGTTTDENGHFILEASPGQKLKVSSIGYEASIISADARLSYKIVLTSSGKSLGEVVVTALGVKREKKALGYSVQELQGTDVNIAKAPDLINSLSGKVAGLQVTSGGSAVGTSSRITIRGSSSFGDNSPLFVINGVPVLNSSSDLDGGGGVDWGDLTSDIDANNIASISVLKGPTAAALYGSRAANGAILVTTKDGSNLNRRLGVDYSFSYVLNKPVNILRWQNQYGGGQDGEEFIWKRDHPEMSYQDYAKKYSYNYVDGNGGGVNDANPVSWGPRLDDGLKLDQWSTGPNSPWISRPDNYKDFFRTGSTMEHSIAVSSNGEKASGRLGFTRSDISGILWNTDQSQNSLETGITLTPSKKLTANANLTYLKKESTIPLIGYSGAGIYYGWVQRDFDTKYSWDQFSKQGNKGFMFPFLDNPYYSLINTNTLSRNRLFGDAKINYQIFDWLSATVRVGTDFYNQYNESITRAGDVANVSTGKGGQYSLTSIQSQETNADFILNFNKKINERFSIDGLAGANYRDNIYKSMWMYAPDLTVPDFFAISNVKGTPSVNNYLSHRRTNGIYGSVNFSYNNYLYLGLTGRNDWSSTLPPNSWSYFYPSVSLSFIFTDALGIKSDVLSYGKIRGSWSEVGQDTGPYQLNKTYSIGNFGGVSVFSPTGTLPPLNLMPQKTKSFEFGTNLRFFNNRIGLDVTYYDQKTTNQILSVPISIATGYGSELINAGEIENKGVEVMLTGDILKNPNGVSWDISINWAKNKNIVNKLYHGITNYIMGTGPGGIAVAGIPGQQWGVLYGVGYVRDAGGNIVIDDNGVPLTSNTPKILGNTSPKWIAGIQNNFSYKNFNLSFLLDSRWGSQFFSTTLWHGYSTGTAPVTVANNVRETGIIVKGVTADGKPNTKRISAQDYFEGPWMWNNEEYPIIDGTFIKLREVSLGYSFNVSKVKWLYSLRLSFIGRDLDILYRSKKAKENGIDPETGFGGGSAGVGWEDYQLPTTASYGLKLNIGF
ncbi:MAG: SusC/RagA family TonB-linked outer membrane protein [Chitinophagaceae bacterium]|nr:MAG: SusC/RagA family TonB-linked outer membrane protein [Chitinophagaceae bacterium]